jgi:putative oxidoreductase
VLGRLMTRPATDMAGADEVRPTTGWPATWRRVIGTTSEPAASAALLYLRLTGGALLLWVHGLPKLMHFDAELGRIEDPLHLGAYLTLSIAIAAEVFGGLAVVCGLLTRVAAAMNVVLLLVAMRFVHPEWSIAEGQFGWLLLSILGALAIAGGGRYSVDGLLIRSLASGPRSKR